MSSNLNLMAPTKGLDAKYSDDQGSVITTNVDQVINWLLNWGRANSVWYMLFGLACCAIELMQTGGPRGDLERFRAATQPAVERSVHHRRHVDVQDGPARQAALRPDGRAALRDLDGQLFELWRAVPVRVFGLQGRRSDHP